MNDEPRKPIEFPRDRGKPLEETPVQPFFDTVTGPNLRWKDNLIQLAVIVAGTVVGTLGGFIYAGIQQFQDRSGPTVLGGFAGLFLSLLLSGSILGLIRGYRATRG